MAAGGWEAGVERARQVIDQETNARIQSCSVASVAYTGINPVDKKCFVFTTKNEASPLRALSQRRCSSGRGGRLGCCTATCSR